MAELTTISLTAETHNRILALAKAGRIDHAKVTPKGFAEMNEDSKFNVVKPEDAWEVEFHEGVLDQADHLGLTHIASGQDVCIKMEKNYDMWTFYIKSVDDMQHEDAEEIIEQLEKFNKVFGVPVHSFSKGDLVKHKLKDEVAIFLRDINASDREDPEYGDVVHFLDDCMMVTAKGAFKLFAAEKAFWEPYTLNIKKTHKH